MRIREALHNFFIDVHTMARSLWIISREIEAFNRQYEAVSDQIKKIKKDNKAGAGEQRVIDCGGYQIIWKERKN